jgi:hypothetical protein
MEINLSPSAQKYFLLAFTQELILNSMKPGIVILQEEIEKDLKNAPLRNNQQEDFNLKKILINAPVQDLNLTQIKKEEPQEDFQKINTLKKVSITIKEENKDSKDLTSIKPIIPRKSVTKKLENFHENIPEPNLPPHLAYLKPIPSNKTNIDLFQLNPFILDPAVKVITVNPEEKIIVSGTMGTMTAALILTKEDINKIISQVSKLAKIPIREGIYRVAIGNLNFSAIISSVLGSKFIIKKMDYFESYNSNLKYRKS